MESIETIVEDTLNSLDNIQRASPNHYFFTRLQAKIECRKLQTPGWIDILFFSPSSAFLSLGIAVILNLTALYYLRSETSTRNNPTHSFSFENEIANGGFFDIENNDSDEDQ